MEKEKKSLLFLHGYLTDKNCFYGQYPFFKQNFNCYSFDFRGFGENKEMPYPYSVSDYAKELKEFIEKNNLIKPCVIAHSFGGRVALKSEYLYNGLLGDLVLTGCAGMTPKKTISKKLKTATYKFLKRFLTEKQRLKFFSSDYKSLSPVMQKSFKLIVNENLEYTLEKIKNRCLILWGEKDKETPLYMAKVLNKNLINSRLSVIKDAGHFAFIDKPYLFNTEVKEFLLSK